MGVSDPLDSMFLFEDKEYEEQWMLNQVFTNSSIFEIEHPFLMLNIIFSLFKFFSNRLVQSMNYNKKWLDT